MNKDKKDKGKIGPGLSNEWRHSPEEPCRYCRRPGKVYFMIDDGPEGRDGK